MSGVCAKPEPCAHKQSVRNRAEQSPEWYTLLETVQASESKSSVGTSEVESTRNGPRWAGKESATAAAVTAPPVITSNPSENKVRS